MKHEKILKRDDGSRVKIIVSLNDHLRYAELSYSTRVFSCEKGKRTWKASYREDYIFRKLTMEQRRKFAFESQFSLVTKAELLSAKTELWRKLTPV